VGPCHYLKEGSSGCPRRSHSGALPGVAVFYGLTAVSFAPATLHSGWHRTAPLGAARPAAGEPGSPPSLATLCGSPSAAPGPPRSDSVAGSHSSGAAALWRRVDSSVGAGLPGMERGYTDLQRLGHIGHLVPFILVPPGLFRPHGNSRASWFASHASRHVHPTGTLDWGSTEGFGLGARAHCRRR
jgi:hypothetical protein